jgi:uncharacterized protein (DUF2147 family)
MTKSPHPKITFLPQHPIKTAKSCPGQLASNTIANKKSVMLLLSVIKKSLMTKRYILPFLIAVFSLGLSAQSTDAPTGRWYTVDDETGDRKSVVEIYEQGGKYFGRIAEILTDKKDAVCTECNGAKKNKPILGMVIIEDLKKDGDSWDDGTIFDPRRDATYKLSAWYEGDANALYIRGKHWTGLYRTQTWKRATK